MTRRCALLCGLAAATILALLPSGSFTRGYPSGSPEPGRPTPKLLLWNASSSAPPGLYWLHSAQPLTIDELVTVTPPASLAAYMAARGYLPSGVALLKHIAALPGQIICRADHAIIIDRKAIAVARNRDRMGRSLPSWQGCRMLRAGEVFVLNADVPDSFDGRYFGILPVKSIAARADPLWTMEQ